MFIKQPMRKTTPPKILISAKACVRTFFDCPCNVPLLPRIETASPTHHKTLSSNGDGTYTLTLDVTGTSSYQSLHTKVDIIIFDASGSVASSSGGQTRLDVAQDAVKSLAAKLLANNIAENPDAVKLSLVSFSNIASAEIEKTKDGEVFNNAIDDMSANSGINWEGALKTANAVATRDNAEVYVIFVSDGDPTYRLTQGGASNSNEDRSSVHNGTTVYGSGNNDNNNKNYSYTLVESKAIVAAQKFLYTGGTFGNVAKRHLRQCRKHGKPCTTTRFRELLCRHRPSGSQRGVRCHCQGGIHNPELCERKDIDDLTLLTSAQLVSGSAENFSYSRSGGSYGSGQAWSGAPEASFNGRTITWYLGSMVLEMAYLCRELQGLA